MKKVLRILLVLFLLVSSIQVAFSQNKETTISVYDKSRVSTANNLEDLVNNEIESGYYEVIKYRDTNILILDFQSRTDQDMSLCRISIFAEDNEYAGEIVPVEIIEEKKKYYLANDLKGVDIASFFNEAKGKNKELTEGEKELKKILINNHIIKESFGAYVGIPNTAVISLHHDSNFIDYRETMVSHELQHGLDFTSSEHWQQTKDKWNSLSSEQKDLFRKFLQGVGMYDIEDTDLIITEFRAFTHTTGKMDFAYYVDALVTNGHLTANEALLLKELSLANGFWEEEIIIVEEPSNNLWNWLGKIISGWLGKS